MPKAIRVTAYTIWWISIIVSWIFGVYCIVTGRGLR